MRLALSLACLALPAVLAAAEVVPIGAGTTPLLEIGTYAVGYRLDRGKPTAMPPGWIGHFAEPSGISCTPFHRQAGKETLLLHSPWRHGTGVTTLTYRLHLPNVKPLRLRTAIAMWEGRSDPGDGATFRVRVEGRTLLDTHYAESAWQEHDLDLAPWAGRQVALTLEVDPGPRRDASFDYSLWGNPRIEAGPAGGSEANRALAARARWQAHRPALSRLGNDPAIAPRPSVGSDYNGNSVYRQDDWYVLEYHGRDHRLRYRLPVEDPVPGRLLAQVDDLPAIPLCSGEGLRLPEDRPDQSRVTRCRLHDGKVEITRLHQPGGLVSKTTLGIQGKSLIVEITTDKPGASAWHLGGLGPVPMRRVITVPYLFGTDVRYLPDQGVFVSTLIDWTRSASTVPEAQRADYQALTDGTRHPVHEIGYVTVSPYLPEVLPNLPYEPSPYLGNLAGRTVYDIWGGRYADNRDWIREMTGYGVEQAAIIHHVWQRGGYDNELPTTLPAHPPLGSEDEMRDYCRAAREAGWLISLHENYVDFYPNSEVYTEADIARDGEGNLQKAWYNGGTRIQSYATAPTAMRKYAEMFSPEIHRRYGTNAAYLDVHTCVPPWFHVDLNARAPGAGMAATFRREQEALFPFMRQTHGGPLFGEGRCHMYWAGLVDGVEAQVDGGEAAPLLLDFDLLKMHPQMVNHGMGYYERWLASGYSGNWGSRLPTQAQIDRYRATEVAYGHAGFVANQVLRLPDYAAKEHHLVAPVQARYGTDRVAAIEYQVDGQLVDVSTAVAAGDTERAYVRYQGGLEVWVNRAAEDWAVRGWVIPHDGFLALGPGLAAGTVRLGGQVADICRQQGATFADARAFARTPGRQRRKIQPSVQEFTSLGSRRFRVTYAWKVEEPLDPGDYVAYVHFDPPGKNEETIAFQQDHRPDPAPAAWRPGSTITDGPYEIEIPAGAGDRFTWATGLFQPGGNRVALTGKSDRNDRIILGTVSVGADGQVSFTAEQGWEEQRQAAEQAYLEHMNPEGKMLDFGNLRTNGTVLVRKRQDGVEIIPLVREAAFTLELPAKDWGLAEAVAASAWDAKGTALAAPRCQVREGVVVLRAPGGAARYLLACR